MKNIYPRGFYIGLSLSWFPPYLILFCNWFIDTEFKYTVPYAFLLGCVIHILFLLTWLLIRRSRIQKQEVLYLLGSLLAMGALTLLSDFGLLSR